MTKKISSNLEDITQTDADLPLYRIDNPVADKQQILNWYTVLYFAIASLSVLFLVYPASGWTRIQLDLAAFLPLIALYGIAPFTYSLKKKYPKAMQLIVPSFVEKIGLLNWIEHIPKDLKKERSGLTAELQVAEAIVTTFKKQKVKVYSRLDETCLVARDADNSKPKDVDVVAIFPTGQRFAISVKKRANAKTVIIDKNDDVRLICRGSSHKMKKPDPIVELIEQEKWLRQHRKHLLFTPGNPVISPSVRVLLFAAPTVVGQSDQHEYATFGGKQYLKVKRDKDFVYLLQEDQLCDFIDALLKHK